MKKGFTLIEVLASFSIIIVLMIIIVPVVVGQVKKSKQTALTTQISLIEKAASDYTIEHPEKLDEYNLNDSYVTIGELQSLNYLSKGTIKNPVTKKKMDGCVVITYDNEKSNYNYTYKEDSCNSLKISTASLISAYETIIKNEPIVTSDDGLYEIDDEYVYRGLTPNNYMTIDNTMYRILSLNKETKTIKVIKDSGDSKIWQENQNNKDYNFRTSSVYTYLNTNFYQTLSETLQKYVLSNATWYTGIGEYKEANLVALKSINQLSSINANVGLLSAYEYVRVSLNESCQNNFLDSNCTGKNYLSKGKKMWLLNSETSKVWLVNENGKIEETNSPSTASVYPVYTLKPNIMVTGLGTKEKPYVLNYLG